MEPQMFSIYRKENSTKQRPYEAYFVNGFWYVAGALPYNTVGGTFEIIVEAQNYAYGS
ncbi:NTF2 fold immunity protein [Hymenobacter sp. BT770]|uniref:NTF2 fold immunity protein n=1 Tax=Hymenobacter sp. BT770 TaxID=2886942 RepID=UPI001D11C558|nr:hypothetical protein [Hymenobacter sp. BT770]